MRRSVVVLVLALSGLWSGCDVTEVTNKAVFASWDGENEDKIEYISFSGTATRTDGFIGPDGSRVDEVEWTLRRFDPRSGRDEVLGSIELPEELASNFFKERPVGMWLRERENYILFDFSLHSKSDIQMSVYEMDSGRVVEARQRALPSPSGELLLVFGLESDAASPSYAKSDTRPLDVRVVRADQLVGREGAVDLEALPALASLRRDEPGASLYTIRSCSWSDDATVVCAEYGRETTTELYRGVRGWSLDAQTGRVEEIAAPSVLCTYRWSLARNARGERYRWLDEERLFEVEAPTDPCPW